MRINSIFPPAAKILFVIGAPSEEDNASGKPLHPASQAGRMFDKLLANAKLTRYEVAIASVAKEKPPGGKIEFFFEDPKTMRSPKPVLTAWIEELRQEILLHSPNIIVALGQTAAWALTKEPGITSIRGYIIPSSLVQEKKVLCTYHPYQLVREFNLSFTAVMDFRKAVRESSSPILSQDTRSLNAFPSKKEFTEYIHWLINIHNGPIALDIETTPSAHLDILGIAANPNLGMSFTFLKGSHPVLRPEEEFDLWLLLGELFKKKSIIMHNGLFDMASMWHYLGILAKGYNKDTMIATHVCWPETPRSLNYISSICLTVPKWKHTAKDTPSIYNCEDAVNTYGCWEFLAKELDRRDHWNTFNFEMRQVWAASMLQLQGISISKDKQKELIQETETEIKYLKQELIQELGKEINFNSPQQLQQLLYQDLKLPVKYKRRKSRLDPLKVTTDAEALKELERETKNPILSKILKYKKNFKLLTSFLTVSTSPEGKIHTSYNITGATTQRKIKGLVVDDEDQHQSFGRWSSSKSIIIPYGSGNLQNIPEKARKMCIAPPGHLYLQADYKQAEAVVVSYEILDLPMIQLFKNSFGLTPEECKQRNLDIHKLTAARNFRVPLEKVTTELRNIGKTIRHAVSYSAGPKVLATKLGCKLADAKKLLDDYHNGCPQLKIWHQKIQQELKKTRTLTNLLGRKHKFLKLWGDDLFRSAYSYIPQSTVGDLLNLALVRLYENYGDELTIALQLHDALYVIVPENLVHWAATVMRQCMLIPLTSSHGEQYYIDIDFKSGPSWGDMHDFSPTYTHEITLAL